MKRKRFRIGDRVVLTKAPPFRLPPGMKDEIGTGKLLKSMVGRTFTVAGFDKYGHVELWPNQYYDVVWIEPELLKAAKPKKILRKPKSPLSKKPASR